MLRFGGAAAPGGCAIGDQRHSPLAPTGTHTLAPLVSPPYST
jgi:hypothetical protein